MKLTVDKYQKVCYNEDAKQNQIFRKVNALFLYGVLFLVPFSQVRIKIGKNAYSADLHEVFTCKVGFVWRQLESAFFGAPTSVGALFVSIRLKEGLDKYESELLYA